MAPLSERALRYVRHREIVSGGALESYGDCPVRWLVERELQPAELDPDSDALARGSYMHEALEEVLRRLGRAITPSSLHEAQEILDRVLQELPPDVARGSSEGVRRAALRAIEADLRRYLAHEASDGCEWQPQALELRFGFEDDAESLPALAIDGIRVRGAIDRGTVRPEYQGGRWRLDRRLQVALYMLAVRELLGLQPAAGLYQPLGGRDLRARGVYLKGADVTSCLVGNDARDEAQLSDDLDDAAGRAIELASKLRRGELRPCPQTCSRDGCKYPGICRSQ